MIIRKDYFNKVIEYLDTEFIKVITGVRRSGKSYLLKMLKKYLIENKLQVLYINFEHPDTFNLQTYEKLYAYIKQEVDTNRKIYILFDEIGEVENWQKLVNGLRIKYNCDIYITGSNANLLSGELATYLSGRYVEIEVFPLSFKEYVEFQKEDRVIDVLLEEYIKFGGFPSVALISNEQIKRDIIKGIYNSVILKDVSLRGNISNTDILIKLSLYLLDNIGNTISSSKISNYFTSTGTKTSPTTINNYLKLLEDSFIFYSSNRYDIRGKERLKTLGKYYIVDLGFKHVMLGRMNINQGSVIENIVYLKLRQSGYDVFVGKYDDYEIDFVCFKGEEVLYVQVALTIPENNDRETRNLLLIKDNFKKIIVTKDYSYVGVQNGIEIIHLTKFLMDDL